MLEFVHKPERWHHAVHLTSGHAWHACFRPREHIKRSFLGFFAFTSARLPRFFIFWWPTGHQNLKNRGKRGRDCLLFCIERVTYQELPQNNAKCKKKGRQKGRAKRAPLLMRPFLRLLVQFQEFATHEKKDTPIAKE